MRRLLLVLFISSAVSDMTVVVNGGENCTLRVNTPEMRDVNRVTLSRYDNGTQVPIFRFCSIKEKQRGCTAIDSDGLELQLGSEHVSVVILDPRATDAGTRILEVIGNNTIKETFIVVFNGSSGGPFITASPPQDFNTVTIARVITGVITVLIIVVVTAVVSVYLYKKKNRKKLDSLDRTVDSEVADTQSSIIGDELDTDASSEEHCLVEKKPEDLDSTHPETLNLMNNNNNNNQSIIIIP
ncbi:uncharacterized protein LOC131532677 isoform X2 [Onychostoma macrolepis]|uniref:uncharacterized protein LOC131532677 isoform X2 n=1 Tax=Onychostoma macrolepis TaxID=369639 RepID=UPI00272C3190|nr:uncharacterized protein LOC131532677 isoform X2 [Onychostoma macrolepis]